MGISHQTGSIVLRGKAWYGFYRKKVVDPTTDDVRSVRVCVRLGIKSQMTKLKARDALKAEIAKQTAQLADGRILKDGTVTFEWFVRNRYFPLRQGDWRPETAIEKTAQIEIDLISKFGSRTIESIDKFELQTHVNHLAKTYCQDRVKQARSYLKSIFDEAIEQEFMVKDPTRTLKIPRNLRPKDKQILTWEQLRAVLDAASQRDRILLMLDMTDALRPSELFAFRWKSFDDLNTLSITETIYRRKIRPFGKTPGSMTKVHLPDGLAAELRQWKLECKEPSCGSNQCKSQAHKKSSPGDPMFPNADGGFLDPANFRYRVLKPLREALELPTLNFQVLRRTIATRAQKLGSVKDVQSHLRHSRADTTANEYMQELPESVQQMVGTVYAMLTSTATKQQQAG
ncbi:tyrosine-type recombinase/integrase [Tunturiibacter gelidoferens]|uniref:Integrase n=1 Tax=Tunturiibacter gelidiferens TaxID=3069689 RepID=A0A9X0QCZ3_9BACT|nr:site-specific integrase [Edaphobacter lichenicola]MBB5328010.1 integrase [Edaphobacter lichenicola]